MKEYYLDRLNWMFSYTKRSFGYCLLKTLCLVVGVPLYAVFFVVEMAVTFLYAIFSVIPVINVVFHALFNCVMLLCNFVFYVNVLPDLTAYKAAHPKNTDEKSEEENVAEEQN